MGIVLTTSVSHRMPSGELYIHKNEMMAPNTSPPAVHRGGSQATTCNTVRRKATKVGMFDT